MQLAFAPSLPLFEQEALNERSGSIIEDVLSFNADRRPTVHMLADGIDYYINEFWTARQRQAHSIHEISYRACFNGQLPEFFI